jgi:hypothetical protein
MNKLHESMYIFIYYLLQTRRDILHRNPFLGDGAEHSNAISTTQWRQPKSLELSSLPVTS